jgi:Spy/CpxP family protein refolding chaperone
MSRKFSLLLPGAIALLLSATPILPAFSQSTNPAPGPRMERWGQNLNLTEDQKAKLKQIRESTRSQIEAVLTDDQKAKLRAAREQQQKARQSFASLNLNDDQKAKIRSIREEARKQMSAVLTDQQRQQLQQQRQQKHQQRSTQPGT